MVFESTRGNSYKGAMGIDDITLLDGACPPPGSCDFEDDTCTWSNIRGAYDDFDWTRQNGNTGSFNTGPKNDHTEQTIKGRNKIWWLSSLFVSFMFGCVEIHL